MDISKHPILKKGYEMMLVVEDCGASEKLTNAVTLAGELMGDMEKLVDELERLKSPALCVNGWIRSSIFKANRLKK